MCVSGVALGIVDREVGTRDATGSDEQAQELCELLVIKPGAAGLIDRRHDFLV